MSDTDLTIRVKSTFEGTGTTDAAKAVEDLGKKTEQTAQKQQAAGKNVQQIGQATGRAAAMVGSMTGAMGAAGPAAAQLGAGLRVIKSLAEGSSAGLMGLATVLVGIGVSAWASYKRKIEESKKAMNELLDDLTSSKIQTGVKEIEKVASGFDRVEKSVSAVRAAQSELAAAWQDLNKAGQEVTAMELTRREKSELAGMSPDDAAGIARIKAKYTGIRESGAVGDMAGNAIRARQSAEDDLSTASARRANIEKTLGSSTALQGTLEAQLARSSSRASVTNPDEEERKRATKEVADFGAQLATVNKTIADLNDALITATTSERAAGLKLQAADIRSTRGISAAAALAGQNTSDALRDADRVRWAENLSDLRSRSSSVASQLAPRASQFRAAADAYDPQRDDYPDHGTWNKAKIRDRGMDSQAKGAEKLSNSAQKLNEQLASMKPEQLAKVFDSIAAQLSKLETAIKNAEQRSKRQ